MVYIGTSKSTIQLYLFWEWKIFLKVVTSPTDIKYKSIEQYTYFICLYTLSAWYLCDLRNSLYIVNHYISTCLSFRGAWIVFALDTFTTQWHYFKLMMFSGKCCIICSIYNKPIRRFIVSTHFTMHTIHWFIYFTLTIGQHSCLREETSTDMIHRNNNVPNNTSIFEHWSVPTVYWQQWFEETLKRHVWIWIKVISAQFPKPLCLISLAIGAIHHRHLKTRNPTGS